MSSGLSPVTIQVEPPRLQYAFVALTAIGEFDFDCIQRINMTGAQPCCPSGHQFLEDDQLAIALVSTPFADALKPQRYDGAEDYRDDRCEC